MLKRFFSFSNSTPERLFTFSLLSLLFFSGTALAQIQMSTGEATALRAKVKAQAEVTKTISSDFTQYKHLDFLSNDIKSKGTLAFKAPNIVKWEYTTPFSYSVLFKDEKLFINDNGSKSDMDLGSNKVFKQLNQLITASIRGDMFDDTAFEIRYFTENNNSLVHFMPKDEQFAAFIKAFHINFNSEGEVEAVKMIEPSDDYTQIVFSNRIQNQPISDAVFSH